MANGFVPVNVAGNYFAGRNQAIDEQQMKRRNALADRQIEREEFQFNEEQKRQLATVMVQAAQYGMQSPNPKAFIEQNYPQLAQLAGDQWASLDDNGVRMKLQESLGVFGPMAGIGPPGPPKDEEFTLSPGQKRFKNGELVAEVASTPDKAPRRVRTLTPVELKANGLPPGTVAQINDETGQINVISASPAGKAPTEGERNAENYASRMDAAEKLLAKDFVPSTAQYMASRKVMDGGAISSSIANKFLDGNTQAYYQAASDWVRAKLRKESGAAIGVQEMEQEIKTYFPMPGDSPQVVEQKARARVQATEGMRKMAGRAGGDQPVRVNSPQEAMQLPSGTRFVTPDGRVKVRP